MSATVYLDEPMPFSGEVHPYADEYPLLSDEQMAALAADIAENGLQRPITLDGLGRIIDGRNRLHACAMAGVEPAFLAVEFTDDEQVAAFISSANDQRRDQSPGVRWMRIGIALQRQGKRSNGRWARGAITESGNNASQRMTQVGLILDVAGRAAALGDDFTAWAELPDLVLSGEIKLDGAHRIAQDFEAHAAMAELLVYQPLAEWIGQHSELAAEAAGRYATPPVIDQPWKRDHLAALSAAANNYQQAATTLRQLIKENK